MTAAHEALASEIERHGPVPFHRLVEVALYSPSGFYGEGGGAGRRRDFITSVEVGPLFGAVISRALDHWWIELGRPDPFVVVDAGAGVGTLARTVLRAAPQCSPALRYLLVERSPSHRRSHADGLDLSPASLSFAVADTDASGEPVAPPPGPTVCSLGELPVGTVTGVVIANELLDNLGFDLLERRSEGWCEVRVGIDHAGRLREVMVPAARHQDELAARWVPEAPVGARIPVQTAAASWLRDALSLVGQGRVVVADYADDTVSLAQRPQADWLRTYRGQHRGSSPLADLGAQDITCEVAVDQLARVRPPDSDRSQVDFLVAHGIDDLVAEGRRVWRDRAHAADLDAMRMRSRVSEAEALLDPGGLGGFRVLEWVRAPGVNGSA